MLIFFSRNIFINLIQQPIVFILQLDKHLLCWIVLDGEIIYDSTDTAIHLHVQACTSNEYFSSCFEALVMKIEWKCDYCHSNTARFLNETIFFILSQTKF